MKKKVIILLLSAFLYTAWGQSQTANQLTNEQKVWLSKANRHEKNGWIYLHIEGTPRERGFQHGYFIGSNVAEDLKILRFETKMTDNTNKPAELLEADHFDRY